MATTPIITIFMKRVSLIAIIITIITAFTSNAQNRWNVYAGGSLSHMCETPLISSDKTYGWGGGAFIGGGYEVRFNSHWSLTPQIEFAYSNNGATLSSNERDFYANHAYWLSSLNLNIPAIASFRFPISENVNLRFGVGPYLQEALAGKHYHYDSTEKEWVSGNFSKRFNVGIIGEAAIETGSHFSYMFRTSYPLLKEGLIRKTITLSLGIGYSF